MEKFSIKERVELPKDSLIRPSGESCFDFVTVNINSTFQQGLIPDGEEPSWGLLRLVAAARKIHGLNAGILDSHRLKLKPQGIRAQLVNTRPSIIGINPTSVNVSEAQTVSRICDELEIPYIVGGVHATLDPKKAREDFSTAAAIVRGSGELVIGELIRNIKSGNKKIIKGVYYENADYDKDGFSPRLSPDDMPLVDSALIEDPILKQTISFRGSSVEMSEFTMYANYGCPFSCSYCASPVLVDRENKETRSYQKASQNTIVNEIEYYMSEFGANAVHFLDNMLFVSSKDVWDFRAELEKRQLLGTFFWRGSTRASVVEKFTNQDLEVLRDTNAWRIALGLESGSEEVLKRIGKKITKQQVETAVYKLATSGIQVKGFFIMGFPGETEEQIMETAQFIIRLKRLGLSEVSLFQFKPYPGTRDFDYLKEHNPRALDNLSYLKKEHDEVTGKAKSKLDDNVWLPDSLRIAEISSGQVRQYVMLTLKEFYGK